MTDIRIKENVFTLAGPDWNWLLLPTGKLDETQVLATSVRVALGTDALASATDVLPDLDSTDRRGWWGDLDAEEIWDGWPIGTKNWLLSRAKITNAMALEGSTLERARQYTLAALQPFVDRLVASSVTVTATRTQLDRIEVSTTIYRGPRDEINLRWQLLWEEDEPPSPAPSPNFLAADLTVGSPVLGAPTCEELALPLTLPNLIAWYKADAGVTLSGTDVITWDDQSGNDYTLTANLSGAKPQYSQTGFNSSYPGITTNGTTAYFKSDIGVVDFHANPQSVISIFAVLKYNAAASAARLLPSVWGNGNTGNDHDSVNAAVVGYTQTETEFYAYFGGAPRDGGVVAVGNNYRLGSVFDGANHTIYVNNSSTPPPVTASDLALASPGHFGLAFGGAWISPSSIVNGTYAEVILFAGAPDAAMRQAIDDYFTTKWGL